MNRVVKVLVVYFLGFYQLGYSQEETKGKIKKISFGIDIGLNIPNNKPAQFLDGSHPFGVSRILSNPQIRQQLETELGYPIKNWEYSRNNTYSPTVYAGLFLGFDLNADWAMVMKVNFSVLRFSTPLVIALDNPQNFTGEFEQATVTAQEQRFGYELGIQRKYNIQPKLDFSIMAGASFNYIQLERQEFIVRSRQFVITRIQNPQILNYQQVDGFGYGFLAEIGVSYELNEKFTLGLYIQGSAIKNKEYIEELTEGTTYLKQSAEEASKFLPSFSTCFRLIWN